VGIPNQIHLFEVEAVGGFRKVGDLVLKAQSSVAGAAKVRIPPLLTVAADGSDKTLVEIRTLMTASQNRPLLCSSTVFSEFSRKKTVHSGGERTA
jgi:hypothetical protein